MGNMFLKIDEDVETWLRNKAQKKGDLSKIVNQIVRSYMNYKRLNGRGFTEKL